jgi:endogenous inhibitor of DNA gyrase (YacG/DUF329 family)
MAESANPGEPVKPAAACPVCGKPVDPARKPFCSKRCADVDLNRWLNGAYVIAGETDLSEAALEAGREPGGKALPKDFPGGDEF